MKWLVITLTSLILAGCAAYAEAPIQDQICSIPYWIDAACSVSPGPNIEVIQLNCIFKDGSQATVLVPKAPLV